MSLFEEMSVFACVVERGNFSRAAETLGVSRSRASEAVKALEARLGVRFLDRSTRHVSPTEEGRLFYIRCQRALEETNIGITELQARRDEPSGRLRIGAPDGFAELFVVPAIASFRELYPKVTDDLVAETRTIDLIEERLDLTIRISRTPEPGLVVRRLGMSVPVVVVAPDLVARVGLPQRPADLTGRPCVSLAALKWSFEWMFRGAGGNTEAYAVEPVLTCSSTSTLRAAALAGVGFTVLPLGVVAKDLSEGALVRVLGDWCLPVSEIFAAYPSNRLITPKVRRFVDHLLPYLRRDPDGLPALDTEPDSSFAENATIADHTV